MVKNEIDIKKIRDLVDDNGFKDRYNGWEIDNTPILKEHIENAKIFIRAKMKKRTSFNYDNTSYGFKHQAEHYFRDVLNNPKYISNGAFIIAMAECGYRVKQIKNPGSGINALFDCTIIK